MSKFIQITASQSECGDGDEFARDRTVYALDDAGQVWIYYDDYSRGDVDIPAHWRKLSTKRGRVEKSKLVEEP